MTRRTPPSLAERFPNVTFASQDVTIADDVTIGDGTYINASGLSIGAGSRIGRCCEFSSNTWAGRQPPHLGERVILADEVRILSSILGDGVSVGWRTMLDRANVGDNTTIGERSTIGSNTQIGSDCQIGSDATLRAAVVVESGCRIGDAGTLHERARLGVGVIVGDSVTVDGYVVIGNEARLEDRAFVRENVAPGQTVQETRFPCVECGASTPERDVRRYRSVDAGGARVCAACVAPPRRPCDRCGMYYPRTEGETFADNGRHGRPIRYCGTCVDNYVQECDRCGDRSFEFSTVYMGGRRSRTTETWCVSCEEHHAFYWDSDGEYHSEEEAGRFIRDYHHASAREAFTPMGEETATHRINGKLSKPLFFGVELEVECPDDSDPNEYAERVDGCEFKPLLASMEHDGSLRNGFEIITHPASLEIHREYWPKLKTRGLKSHNTTTCGMHIHFSRNAVSKLTLAKLIEFVGDSRNSPMIRAICRRDFCHYAGSCKKDKVSHGALYSGDRYEAINTTNRHTIEFRLPKGTTVASTIIATIEFLHAAIRFCERTSVQDLTEKAFLAFVARDEWLAETRFLRPMLVQKGRSTVVAMRLPKPRPTLASDAVLQFDGDAHAAE